VFPVPNPPPAPVSETRSPVLPINLHPVFVNQHSQLNPNFSASILQRLAPAEGPVSGGLNILLSGTNFPTHPYQLYARFGTVVVPTVRLLFLPPQKTNSSRRSGTTHTRSSAGYLLLRPRVRSALHFHYPTSPEDRNLARVTAGLNIIKNMITCWWPFASHRERNV